MGTLFSCPHCSSVYYINFDGLPELAQSEPEIQPGPPSEAHNPSNVSSEEVHTNYSHQVEVSYPTEAPQESAYQYNEYSDATESEEPVVGGNSNYEHSNSTAQDSHHYDQQDSPVDNYDFGQTLDQVSMGEDVASNSFSGEPTSNLDSSDFSDVVSFGNADTMAGPLTYAVVIEGIDSAQVFHDVKEAMYDSKFGWDVNEQMAQVNRGRLVLPGLSPAKAFVLINRIKYLPLKISWRQDVLSNS